MDDQHHGSVSLSVTRSAIESRFTNREDCELDPNSVDLQVRLEPLSVAQAKELVPLLADLSGLCPQDLCRGPRRRFASRKRLEVGRQGSDYGVTIWCVQCYYNCRVDL